jgi:hypothetical protein
MSTQLTRSVGEVEALREELAGLKEQFRKQQRDIERLKRTR